MRVLYISRGGNPHDRRILAALAETTHEVTFLPMEVSAEFERGAVPTSVRVLDSDGELDSTKLGLILEQIQPELIHAGPIQSGAYLAAQTNWHPLVSMSWGSDLLIGAESGKGRDKAKYALSASDVLLADCETVREAAIVLGMREDRIVVFPWGTDLERFSPGQGEALREQLGWADDFVMLSTRSLEPLYGVDLIVTAFISASNRNRSLRLLMLGDGSQRAELIGRIEKEGLSDRVHAPGSVEPEELPAYYGAANLYLSASHSDGSSVSLLESMACGLPAIVSDIPSNQEWVVPELSGWWFRDGDEAELAAVILEAVAARERLVEMGAQARTIAEQRADWKRNFSRLLEAYEVATAIAQPQT